MKKGNYTPGPWESIGDKIFAKKEGDVLVVADDIRDEDGNIISAAPDLNERLLDNTSLLIRVHSILCESPKTPQLYALMNDLELAVVKNREVLMKANGIAGAVEPSQDTICGPLKDTFGK